MTILETYRPLHANRLGDDRYLLIDDSDDDHTAIITVLSECRHSSRDYDVLRGGLS
jgi:hypothetical protein